MSAHNGGERQDHHRTVHRRSRFPDGDHRKWPGTVFRGGGAWACSMRFWATVTFRSRSLICCIAWGMGDGVGPRHIPLYNTSHYLKI